MEGFTAQQFLETMEFFRRYPMAALSLEDQVNTTLPNDLEFRMTSWGFGRLYSKEIYVSSRDRNERN